MGGGGGAATGNWFMVAATARLENRPALLLFILLLVLVPLGYVACQVRMVWSYSGIWRWSAAMPLFPWALWAFLGWPEFSDPVARKLIPFDILLGSLAALIYLGILARVKYVSAV